MRQRAILVRSAEGGSAQSNEQQESTYDERLQSLAPPVSREVSRRPFLRRNVLVDQGSQAIRLNSEEHRISCLLPLHTRRRERTIGSSTNKVADVKPGT